MAELIPKEKPKTLGIVNFFFYLFLIILILLGIYYLGLIYKNKDLSSKIQNVKNEINKTKTSIESEKETLTMTKKIENFSILLGFQKIYSNFFKTIEELTLQKVWFSKLELKDNSLILNGNAQSLKVLAEQVMILKGTPIINDLSLTKVNPTKEGLFEFELKLNLDNKIFSQQQ